MYRQSEKETEFERDNVDITKIGFFSRIKSR